MTDAPADKSELKAGAKVIAFFKKLADGSFEANRISVGLNGLTPPMRRYRPFAGWRPAGRTME